MHPMVGVPRLILKTESSHNCTESLVVMCIFPISCCGIQMRWLVVIMCIFCHIMINFIADEGLHDGLLWQGLVLVSSSYFPTMQVHFTGCLKSLSFVCNKNL